MRTLFSNNFMTTEVTNTKRLFTLEELSTEEGRREYYRIDPKNQATWNNNYQPAYINPAFNDELKERHGTDIHGDQIVRIEWAASIRAQQFKDDGFQSIPYLGRKYPWRGGFRLKQTIGYSYFDEAGVKRTAHDLRQVPKGVLCTEQFGYDDLGERKFVVEMKYTLAQMVQCGWCPDPETPEGQQWCVRNGKRYRVAPNPKGEYMFGFFIETKEGDYRDVTYEDVLGIHEIFARALNETDEERVVRKRDEYDKINKALAKQEAEKEASQWEDSIIRVEKGAVGKVYG